MESQAKTRTIWRFLKRKESSVFDAAHKSKEYGRGIEVRIIVLVAKTKISRT